ncbi:MAG: helix-turn-helix domain-containing protein, partial [Cellulomonadaceae bacterium]|nr:helix-turn-helix domain-containing protein [Cellulomonadaceae bacterium]
MKPYPVQVSELELDSLVDEWLPLPDVAERLGIDVGKVRRLVQETKLLAVRHGERKILSVPARFLIATAAGGWQVVPSLQGTLVLLADAGFSDEEAIGWLF